MFKSIITYLFCTIALGSCSINQNSVTNTTNSNNVQHSSVKDYSEVTALAIEQSSSLPALKLTAPAQTHTKCKPATLKPVPKPKFSEETILSAKTQKDMVNYLLLHIEQLDKAIDGANSNIKNINNQNSKDCK